MNASSSSSDVAHQALGRPPPPPAVSLHLASVCTNLATSSVGSFIIHPFSLPDRSYFLKLYLFLLHMCHLQTVMTSYGKKGLLVTHPGGMQNTPKSREVKDAP